MSKSQKRTTRNLFFLFFKFFNQAAFRARTARDLTDALVEFLDCSIVIPPTEIQNESMLSSIISFQKKILKDRAQTPDLMPRRDSKTRRGEYHFLKSPSSVFMYCLWVIFKLIPLYIVSIASGVSLEDPLSRTGRPFGGMIRDIKRRYQYYKSDITDALNAQVIAAIIFIYFAALSPAITFGGLLGMCNYACPNILWLCFGWI